MRQVILLVVAITVISSGSHAMGSYFDRELKMVVCKEPLPEFTLSETSQPSDSQVKDLCTCIWNTFPSGGWEQQTSQKLRNGQDAGWRTTALISRFGSALEKCGGYKL